MNLTETCRRLADTADIDEVIDLIAALPPSEAAVAYSFGVMVRKDSTLVTKMHERVREGDAGAVSLRDYAKSLLETPEADKPQRRAFAIADEIGVEIPDRAEWEESAAE